MRSVVALLALAMAGCAAELPVVVVKSEPVNHAWWLRTTFNPSGKALRGLPVSKIDAAWCAINELEAEIFPEVEEVQATTSGVRAPDAKFSLETTLHGKAVTLVLAVFKQCDGKTGTALVGLSPGDAGGERLFMAQAVSFPAAWATIHQAEGKRLELWWCFECDNIDTLEWNEEIHKFVAVEEGDA